MHHIKHVSSVIRKEKEEVTDKSQPKSIDLSLPGWGEWGGKNLPVSSRKKRRFIINFPEVVPRKDTNKGTVIINEEKNNGVVSHQVSIMYLIIFHGWNPLKLSGKSLKC
jgi:U3 small nucleolar RNA-associated protein 14